MNERERVALRCWMISLALLGQLVVQAALEPTVLHCASVDQAGGVTLTWSQPADPGNDFGSYQVYWSNSIAGPFVPQGPPIFTYATSTWTDPTANGSSGPQFYFITTLTSGLTPEESLPSDTVSTIFLQVFQSVPPGNADLSWNALAVAPSADDTFSVWLEYPIGTLQLLAEVAATTFAYQHVVSVCEDSLTFHIRRSDQNGCVSYSNWDGDVFRDVTPPTSPIITTVTVDTITGSATLDWEPSPEADTDGYIIVFEAPGGAVIIDTIFGQSNTVYEWSDSEADLGSESYTVAAFDTCEVGVPPSPNTSPTRAMHTTMYLGLVYDECDATVRLVWSEYVGWPVEAYEVYVQQNGGLWTLLTALDGSTLSYLYAVQPFRQYCFAIKAVQGVDLASSLSNRACVTTDYPGLPAFNYIRAVSVIDENEIQITDSVDVTALVQGYRLERSVNGEPYETIDLRAPGPSAVLIFVDTDVEPTTTSYQYRVVVLDGCGNESITSNIGANIVLRARAELTGFDRLEWNGYEDWAGSVQAYALYRSVENDPFALLNILAPDPWIHMDNVSNLTATTGRFCYYVVALETANPSGINSASQSNVSCTVQEELVYIPNAIVVGGANPLFKPELAYVDVTEYELSIINRWGQVFWTTNDPYNAWDGTASGAPVPMGIYAYYCKFKNGAGRTFEKRGTVTKLSATD